MTSARRDPTRNQPLLPGLYVHVPFCIRKCAYCDFYSSTRLHLIPDYVRAVLTEAEFYRGRWSCIDTLYLGGGTPSVLGLRFLEQLLNGLRRRFHLTRESEISIEVNPGDLSREHLTGLRDMGIHRVTIGVQSFRDDLLKFLGRRHDAKAAWDAMEYARQARFDHVGIDLMYGIPGQTLREWLRDLERAARFHPEHLSCYELSFENETPLHTSLVQKEVSKPSERDTRAMFLSTSHVLTRYGYEHYEVSNFALGSFRRSRHNQKYWTHAPYLGLGPSAHSFDGTSRWWNHRSVNRYLRDTSQGRAPVAGAESLEPKELLLEALYFACRTRDGLRFETLRTRFGAACPSFDSEIWSELEERGLIRRTDSGFHPTRRGLAVSDTLPVLLA